MSTTVAVNPEILRWAIDRAGLDLDEFVSKLPNVEKWLSNEKEPTVKQLEAFSKKVYLPFGYLFLSKPPDEKLPIPFFRSGSATSTNYVGVNVYDTVLLLQQRQDWLRNHLIESDFEPLTFVGKFADRFNKLEVVADIRDSLGLDDLWASKQTTWEESLQVLTERIEDVGIITVFNGVVENNTHRPIAVEECRGFVLVDDYAPFLFVNNSDSKAAQMFTLVHELAHIWTGQSAGFDFRQLRPADNPVEIFCDSVAAEFLVPSSAFRQVWATKANIKYCARHFKVSEIVIARRALDLGKITRDQFFGFYNEYISREYVRKDNRKGGGDFYATARKRVSVTFAAHVNNAVQSGQLLHRDAYRLTGLKGDTYQTFFAEHI
jgi:Zn-dependent peptidase ImmA (M78 family)